MRKLRIEKGGKGDNQQNINKGNETQKDSSKCKLAEWFATHGLVCI